MGWDTIMYNLTKLVSTVMLITAFIQFFISTTEKAIFWAIWAIFFQLTAMEERSNGIIGK